MGSTRQGASANPRIRSEDELRIQGPVELWTMDVYGLCLQQDAVWEGERSDGGRRFEGRRSSGTNRHCRMKNRPASAGPRSRWIAATSMGRTIVPVEVEEMTSVR